MISVFTFMLCNASESSNRGTLERWSDEAIASALGLKESDVFEIRKAMQNRVLDGDLLTRWDDRQPKREDDSRDRVRAFRERQSEKINQSQEQETETENIDCNAMKRSVTQRNTRGEVLKALSLSLSLSKNWEPSADDIAFCKAERPDLDPVVMGKNFRDHWVAQNAEKPDWSAVWRIWIRNEKSKKVTAKSSPKPWFETVSGVKKRGSELGIAIQKDEPFDRYKRRVYKAAGWGEWIEADIKKEWRFGAEQGQKIEEFYENVRPKK